MKTRLLTKLAVIVFGAMSAGAVAAPLEIALPAETTRLADSPLPGYALATAFCYTCHSADYQRMQPVSSRAYWKASVTKMQKTFGAPIPDDAIEPIVDYLVKTYGSERTTATVPASSPKAGAAPKK